MVHTTLARIDFYYFRIIEAHYLPLFREQMIQPSLLFILLSRVLSTTAHHARVRDVKRVWRPSEANICRTMDKHQCIQKSALD